MATYDPVQELEITERSWQAMAREARQPHNELHRRIIDARNQARYDGTDALLRRITATLSAA